MTNEVENSVNRLLIRLGNQAEIWDYSDQCVDNCDWEKLTIVNRFLEVNPNLPLLAQDV